MHKYPTAKGVVAGQRVQAEAPITKPMELGYVFREAQRMHVVLFWGENTSKPHVPHPEATSYGLLVYFPAGQASQDTDDEVKLPIGQVEQE
jgi:hypothetical protein